MPSPIKTAVLTPDFERTPGGACGHRAKAGEDEGCHKHEQRLAARRGSDLENRVAHEWQQVARMSEVTSGISWRAVPHVAVAHAATDVHHAARLRSSGTSEMVSRSVPRSTS